MGKTANYTTVTAQLMIDGKNYGPHNFVLQLRDEKDHRPLPGSFILEKVLLLISALPNWR